MELFSGNIKMKNNKKYITIANAMDGFPQTYYTSNTKHNLYRYLCTFEKQILVAKHQYKEHEYEHE
mgnify:CR=1 FL=1